MRLLIASLILVLSFTANANEVAESYACLSADGKLVKYNSTYGELSVMTATGEILVDADDGYDEIVTFVETHPVTVVISVVHHEEPEITVLELSYRDRLATPYTGYFRNGDGTHTNITCL